MSCFVQVGKLGDICNVLPIAYHEFEETGKKPVFVAAKKYASILDGCSYVIPAIWDGDWQDLKGAIRFARRNFSNVVVTSTFGKEFNIQQSETSFQLDQWKRAGCKEHFDKWPLVFDQRSTLRERILYHTIIPRENPKERGSPRYKFILLADVSESSPFTKKDELAAMITKEFEATHKVIRLSEVKADFIFDLLALYDKADAIVTIETVHLHLAKASKVPIFAITLDGWRGSLCSLRYRFCLKYGQWEANKLKFLFELQKSVNQGDKTEVKSVELKPVEAIVEEVKPDIINRPISLVFRRDQLTKDTFVIRRSAALGDSLAATCVAKKLGEMGHPVIFQSNEASHCILSRVPWVKKPQSVNGMVHIDLDGAYEKHPNRTESHFYDIFIECANEQLKNWNIVLPKSNLAPRMVVTDEDKTSALALMSKYPKPWTIICPRSNHWLNRTVPNQIWEQSARTIDGTKFWLARDDAPSGIIDLKCRHFDNAIRYIACADLLVTVDTGPMHVSAALGIPVVAIEQSSSPKLHLSDQQDWISIAPKLECLNCQKEKCPLDADHPPCQNIPSELISKTVNDRLGVTRDGVSAVICIYRPSTGNLQRCINAVLPQVNEVIVVSQHNSVVPDGAPRGDKIRYVTRPGSSISYGRNANYGARMSNNRWIWFVNDDCFPEMDVVQKLKSCADEKTGIVSHLFLYPDLTIQHGGKYRPPTANGWGHLDHNGKESRIKSVVQMESVCLASGLVRRKAFFDASGYDQDFSFYAEDDALCMQTLRAGWKILYNPHAKAIHIDHASTRNVLHINNIVRQSNEIFSRKWSWYLKDLKPVF